VRGFATLHELETVYSIDDLADFNELVDYLDDLEWQQAQAQKGGPR